MGIIILVVICIGLSAVLIWKQTENAEIQRASSGTITTLSNDLAQTQNKITELEGVNVELQNDLTEVKDKVVSVSNELAEVKVDLTKTEESLKAAEQEIARRDTRITDLESQNIALDRKALELSTAITNLTGQIDDTRRKLAASEGDKAFLEKELQRMVAEKTELERQFNDISALKAQVAKLREELNISRRLEWIRQGIFARADQKGAEQLMQKPAVTPAREPSYDLNVEVGADGTVRVIPASTNRATATPPPTSQ